MVKETGRPFHHRVPTEVHIPDLPSWKPGCKSPRYAAETLTCGWWSLVPSLWWEKGLTTQMLQGRRSRGRRSRRRKGESDIFEGSLRSALLHYPTQEPSSLQLSHKGGMFWKRWLWWFKHPVAAPFTAGAKSHCRQWERGVQGPHNLGLGQRSWLL